MEHCVCECRLVSKVLSDDLLTFDNSDGKMQTGLTRLSSFSFVYCAAYMVGGYELVRCAYDRGVSVDSVWTV